MTSIDLSLQPVTLPDIEPPLAVTNPPKLKLPDGSCDCHAHLFGPQETYPYIAHRSYTPHDASEQQYRHLLKILGFQRAVLVQPSVYGTDNSKILDTLKNLPQNDNIQWRGVAVIDSTITDAELLTMHTLGIRGIRFNLLFKGGVDLKELNTLANRIKPLGWHIQLLVDLSILPDLDLLKTLPVPCVIDHIGHIHTSKGIYSNEFKKLLDLLDDGNAWVKISGFNRISKPNGSSFNNIDSFISKLLAIHANKCVFGTDWPHVKLETSMPNDTDLVNEFLRLVPDSALQTQILVDNPKVLYDF